MSNITKVENDNGVTVIDSGNSTTISSERYPRGLKLAIILLSLALGTLLVALDTTIISVAIPKISTDFKTLDQVGWYGSAYLITLTAFQPISGNIYKTFDPKLVYLVFIVIFEVGSVLCAASPSSPTFIGGRAIAGIGAAGLIQGALGIITYVSTLEKRPLYMAIVISVFGITGSCGPVIGGALTDRVSWRWCFWINVPLGAIVLVLVLFFLHIRGDDPSTRQLPLRAKLQRLDFGGIVLLIGAVCCLFIALQQGGTTVPWRSARIIGLFIGFGLISIVFGFLQWKLRERATIPVRFLRQKTVVFGSLFLFFDNMSNYIKLYYLPFYFQAAKGSSAIHSGVNYIALAFPQLVALLFSGGVITRFGYYMPVILVGQVICSVGTGLLTTIGTTTPTAVWATFLVLVGIGLGMGINAPHIAIQGVMESDDDVFLANGIATFFSQLGGALAVSIGEAILVDGLTTKLPKGSNTISPSAVIRAGPLNLTALATSPADLQDLRGAYVASIVHVLIFALAVVCVSVPTACGMQWLNLKKISEEREKRKSSEPAPVATEEKL